MTTAYFQARPHLVKVPQIPQIAVLGWDDGSVDREYLLYKQDDLRLSPQTTQSSQIWLFTCNQRTVAGGDERALGLAG